MKIEETIIKGCYLITPRSFTDNRGSLTKIYHELMFQEMGLDVQFREEYFSVSSKGVLRGLHFQIPPMQHAKCVTCVSGKIFDVVVDLRKNSPTFGKHFCTELDGKTPSLLYVPEGLAHGFVSLEDDSIFLNRSTTVYSPECDRGIHWDSCGIVWPDLDLIISHKDQEMPDFENFNSPF
ncbi:dTDP-4-dehydrorhamnose 3,5-epimerase [Mongoliibacter ruber]|uniref:dTDP-4-dehydrorhamnose 3,5-epimerase n=1 Tax=Mongoliibacter ruber TaxID=1750599 RepID=A0A2T0WW11_9BACT|nr:dTDP-4-dehydrorhamnose 3,5-epimerase [Mongoliibacter ruber]PRY90875.1 dTDP-4-dehydrorhamnose 3,5-epimerase/CDP-3, 6-dideoxy-D-glycero-D-glycero-4-hexulose-5-epimerase [Mongoliibacter ruber]